MRTVRDVMRWDIDVLRTTESAADAACYLATASEDTVPLCLSDGSLAGEVSARDIVAKVVATGRDPREVRLAEFAEAADILALDVDVPVEDAVSIMYRHHRACLPVVEDDRVVGQVNQRDVARSVAFRPFWADA